MSERASEWPSTYVPIIDCSASLCAGGAEEEAEEEAEGMEREQMVLVRIFAPIKTPAREQIMIIKQVSTAECDC